MKITAVCLMVLFSIGYSMGCAPLVHHTDTFYNFSRKDFPRDHLPLIDPVEATRESPSSPWELGLANTIWIQIPDRNNAYYGYSLVEELEKIAIKNGVIMAYSPYVGKQANAYIQNNFYHWFVVVPSKKSAEGFRTEDEFSRHIETIGIQNPDCKRRTKRLIDLHKLAV